MTGVPPDASVDATTPERVIWGLVGNVYGVAAKTPGITDEQAWELSRTPEMGDTPARVDNAIAHLWRKKWGFVVARYYTNATTDSANRTTIVYDVVRPSVEQLRLSRHNPFRLLPALPASRGIDEPSVLDAPGVLPELDEARRLKELLREVSTGDVGMVLGAVLDGPLVLWSAKDSVMEILETIVLLLPPVLRPVFTFQSYTLKPNVYMPQLTIGAEHLRPLPNSAWSLTLPREAARISDRARATAKHLLDLAGSSRLAVIHAVYQRVMTPVAPENGALLDDVECLLRIDHFNLRRDESDAASCVSVLATATSAKERQYMCTELLEGLGIEQAAAGVAKTIADESDAGWPVLNHLIDFASGGSLDAGAHSPFLTELSVQLSELSIDEISHESRVARTSLAAFAARRGDSDVFMALAPDVAEASILTALGWPEDGASPLGELAVARLKPPVSDVPGVVALLDALTAAQPGWKPKRSEKLASPIGFAAVRRALAGKRGSRSESNLQELARALRDFRVAIPALADEERALHALLSANPQQGDAAAKRAGTTLLKAGASAVEFTGWARLLLLPSGSRESAYQHAATFLATAKSLPTMAQEIGVLLDELSEPANGADASPGWLQLVALSDATSAGARLTGTLVRAIDAVRRGGKVGPVFDACVALSDRDVMLDAKVGAGVLAALTALRAEGQHAHAALRLRYCCSAVEQIGDASVADHIMQEIWHKTDHEQLFAGRMWRVASALRLVDRVRMVQEMAPLAASARAMTSWTTLLPKSFVSRINQFFGIASPRRGKMQVIKDALTTNSTRGE